MARVDRYSAGYLLLSGAVVAWAGYAAWAGEWMHTAYDHWYYLAHVRAVVEAPLSPGNALFDQGPALRGYTPHLVVVGWCARLLGLSFMEVATLTTVLSVSGFIVGLYLFASVYFRSPRAPLYCLVAALFCWGTCYPFTGMYGVAVIGLTGMLPSTLGIGVALAAVAAVVVYLRRGDRRMLVAAWVVGAISLVTHQVSSLHYLGLTLALALLEPEVDLRRRVVALLHLPLAFGLACLWPYYQFFDQSSAQMVTTGYELRWGEGWWDPHQLLVALGPALLGPLVYLVDLRKRRHLAIVAWGSVAALWFAFAPYVPTPLPFRLLPMAVLMAQLAIAGALAEGSPLLARATGARLLPRLLAGMVLAALVVFAATRAWRQHEESTLAAETNGGRRYLPLEQLEPLPGPVMTDTYTARIVTALLGPVVDVQPYTWCLDSEQQRVADVRRFFAPTTTDKIRARILERYRCSRVVVDQLLVDPATCRAIEGLGRSEHLGNQVVVVTVRSETGRGR